MDVGHSFGLTRHGDNNDDNNNEPNTLEKVDAGTSFVLKKAGFLFDCVDLCIEEGGIYNILGATGSGKSTLLQILAQRITPTKGKVVSALNVDVAWLDPAAHDQLIFDANDDNDNDGTALEYLQHTCPHRTEAEIRAECTAFGLSPRQITTAAGRCLSRGERARLAVVQVMLQHHHHPHVLVWDTPTSHLDGDSVEALAHGLQQWNGTVVLACHDAHLLRLLDAQCFVLIPAEGKLRRVVGGIDAYVRSFANNNKR